jgi:ABC-type amino acid transport substrate-binding protein
MQFRPDIGTLSPAVLNELAPGGVLRAGINLSNFLLVTGRTANGDPVGVSPDMARALAEISASHCAMFPTPRRACWQMRRRATNGISA